MPVAAMAISRVAIKGTLQALNVFSFLRAVMRRCRAEQRLGTQRTATFDRNVLQPFGHSQCRFLHLADEEVKGRVAAGLSRRPDSTRPRYKTMPPSSAPPETSPSALFVPRRSSCGLMPTRCVSQERIPPTLFVSPPIVLSAPEPFFGAKPLIRSASAALTHRMAPCRSETLFQELSGLTSQFLSAPSCVSHEAPEARSVDSTLLPPRIF